MSTPSSMLDFMKTLPTPEQHRAYLSQHAPDITLEEYQAALRGLIGHPRTDIKVFSYTLGAMMMTYDPELVTHRFLYWLLQLSAVHHDDEVLNYMATGLSEFEGHDFSDALFCGACHDNEYAIMRLLPHTDEALGVIESLHIAGYEKQAALLSDHVVEQLTAGRPQRVPHPRKM